MKKAYFSIRFSKNRLPQKYIDAITHALFLVNQAKHFAFQTQVKEKRSGNVLRSKSMQKVVKQKYQLNDYYTNSAVQDANALISSQNELKKMYVANKKQQISSVKKKIKSTKSRLSVLRKIKQSFVKGKPTFNKTSREQQKGNFFCCFIQKENGHLLSRPSI
jgi:hypothetical protein